MRAEIFEVGPRDGLQNEPRAIPVADKIALVELLGRAGFRRIEMASFVSPKWVAADGGLGGGPCRDHARARHPFMPR